MLTRRDERYDILKTLLEQRSIGDILESNLAARWVKEQAAITGKSRPYLYNIFHNYLEGNFSKNALLANYWRCGGKGREREQKCKLGRPNALVKNEAKKKNEAIKNHGYVLEKVDKEKLALGWRYFANGRRTRKDAYLETMKAFYSRLLKREDGQQELILLPTHLRPTEAQFARWGPVGNPRLTLSRMQLGEIDWAKKYKGLTGTARDGITAVGMLAACDATTNDVYLKSVTSRLKTVGFVNRLLIVETRVDLIIGMHCGFEAPSSATFLLAVAHAASSKVNFCARFGIQITDDDWPAVVARAYIGDNGEYRNEASRAALLQFGASIDYIPSGQPQYNSLPESKHHLLHARLDHNLDGTTYGKVRKRGQRHPSLDACVNYHEYMTELVKEALYHNNYELVPHLLTAEMRRDNVEPTRISIYRWLVDKGYIVSFTPAIEALRAHLYPSYAAVLTQAGVYLLRPDCGDRAELIYHARFMSDYLVESGLLEHARRKGNIKISVRCNPTDLVSVWLPTESGLVELKNIYPETILIREATLQDLISIMEDDKVYALKHRGADEQRRADIASARDAMLDEAQEQKRQEMMALPKPLTKKEEQFIGKNREAEIGYLAAQSYFSTEKPQPKTKSKRSAPKSDSFKTDSEASILSEALTKGEVTDPAATALKNYRSKQS